MDVNLSLLLALLATLLVIAYLLTRLHRVRGQLSLIKDALMAVSYTHLDVYKRQPISSYRCLGKRHGSVFYK